MHRKMRKFNKDTSPLKEDDSLVMDYDMGDIMMDRRPGKVVDPGFDFEFENINSKGYKALDNDDVDEWVSSNRNAIRPSRTSSYVNNRQLYESSINNLKEQINILKLGNTLAQKGDTVEIKLRINQLIRSIDKSLALINKSE